ncbi:MAG: membrane protein insertion efficiency factor YidD [Deltaproteobacteria bacterium]|nr:membrane protein insertion efficiency factor YidD [Deltaproteobacteria bacterium]
MPAIWISGKSRTSSERSSLIKSSFYRFRYIPVALIDIYQHFISPFWPPSCRFYPTCSTYARHAIKKYGIIKGGFLALVRISKCHPFHPGGYDPLI